MKEKRNMVGRDELVGFRNPLLQERTEITTYIIAKLSASETRLRIIAGILVILIIPMWAGVLNGIKQKGIKILLAELLIVSGFTAALFFVYWVKRDKKALRKAIAEGAFEILDCHAYTTDPSVDFVGSGTACIYNRQGQYCTESFVVDYESLRVWEHTPELSFRLMKCRYLPESKKAGKGVYYELFTERKLQGR